MIHRFSEVLARRLFLLMPLSWRVKLEMRRSLGYWPNIDNPKTFNEKIAYRKLKQRDNRFKALTDKWDVRKYVQSKIGDNYISKVYAVISSISELDLESLPESFVAKPTHKSHEILFVRSKTNLDRGHFVRVLNDWLRSKFEYGINNGEYWYAEMPSRVMFEEWLSDGKCSIPLDYKFFVFHGRVQAIEVDFDRFTCHAMNFYTREWEQIPMRKGNRPNKLINPEDIRPAKLEEMIVVAEALGSSFDFVRVDLYYLSNFDRVVFGEMTFAPGSGYSPFMPYYDDLKFGRLWQVT